MINKLNKFTLKQLFDKYDKIEIPKIQRDYAFGRNDDITSEKRKNFIRVLVDHIKQDKNLHLDFVYGIVNQGTFIPLDGQQRITTLWLIELYLMKRTNKLNVERLDKFTYETRVSSKEFGHKLISKWELPKNNDIKQSIYNQHWFFNAWKYDPTVSSMIIVLEEIANQMKNLDENKDYNTNKITFSFLEVSKLGKPEELYIKMNSRGKELSRWEIFKSQLFKKINNMFSRNETENIKKWFDNEFLEFFWTLKVNDKTQKPEEVEPSMYHLIKMIMYVKLIEKDGFGGNDIRNEFKYDTKTNNEDILYFLKIHEYDLIDEDLISNANKFIRFLKKNEEMIREVTFARFGNKKGLLIDRLFEILNRSGEVQPADIALFYAYYKYVETLHNDDLALKEKELVNLKQIIRIVNNLDEPYRKQINILVPFIRGLNYAISNEQGIIDYFSKTNFEQLKFGSLSSEQAYEEKYKASEIIKINNEEITNSIYIAESNEYLDGTIGFLLRISKLNNKTLSEVYEKFSMHFKKGGKKFYVSKEEVIRMIEYIQLENILLSNAIPRNDGPDEYAANKARDYAWRKLFIDYGYSSKPKDILWFYNYLYNNQATREEKDFSVIEQWFYYHNKNNVKLINKIGGIKVENNRIFGLGWDRTGFNAQKYDIPLFVFKMYFPNNVEYNGFRSLDLKEDAIYVSDSNKKYKVSYDYESSEGNILIFKYRNIEKKRMPIKIKTFENDLKNLLKDF